MVDVDTFSKAYPDLLRSSKSFQIDYFAYYLISEKKMEFFTVKDIYACFSEMHMQPYSNISAYLTNNIKGKDAKFIYSKKGYSINRAYYLKLEDEIGNKEYLKEPTNDIFPIELFENTRGYLVKMAKQTVLCYDNKLYDAFLVMLRKLMETLIIETFEKYKLDNTIKDSDGNFYFLSTLVPMLLDSQQPWNISRNAQSGFVKIKTRGDLSAHNRRYSAKKSDIDQDKDTIRICIQELIGLIDYPNWKI
ncbi:hypothetical protein [uncultured Sphaerochaeta sp.]|uniref:hypothetical protein n=1 Tax=uncultured Sphaerochaeta sp. TaxID=886478 RepID=UPI002AA70443|nr:hypothetical protein [uncultured Sphaerochaeta sp.]